MASGERPISGVTVSQPCGDEAVVTAIGSVLVAAGSVAVSFAAAGKGVVLTWYVKLSDDGLTVGPGDWAAAIPAQKSRGSRRFIPASSAGPPRGIRAFPKNAKG